MKQIEKNFKFKTISSISFIYYRMGWIKKIHLKNYFQTANLFL